MDWAFKGIFAKFVHVKSSLHGMCLQRLLQTVIMWLMEALPIHLRPHTFHSDAREVYPGTNMVVRRWLTSNGEVLGQPVGTCTMGTCTLN